MTRKAREFRRPRERRVNRPRTVRDDGPAYQTGPFPLPRAFIVWEPDYPELKSPDFTQPGTVLTPRHFDRTIELCAQDKNNEPNSLLRVIDAGAPEFPDDLIEAVLDEFLEQMAEVGK